MRTLVPLLLAMAGCESAADSSAVALATRLADENGGRTVPSELREAYVACGTEALSTVAADRIDQAMQAPDTPAIWAILGSETLDSYVAICRKAEQKELGKTQGQRPSAAKADTSSAPREMA